MLIKADSRGTAVGKYWNETLPNSSRKIKGNIKKLSADGMVHITDVPAEDHWRHCATFCMMETDSGERNLGYRTLSFTILSNTSSSSSPGNGDW